MRTLALCLVLLVGLVGVVYAEEEEGTPEVKRGLFDGKYVDDYFGVVYSADGLKKGLALGLGGPTVIWSGSCDGGVDVELICMEAPRELTAEEWVTGQKNAWAQDGKERKEMEEGAEPHPWVVFVQPSMVFERQHGYAFYPRGFQCLQVHAQVREKSDTSTEAIKKALMGLELKETDAGFLLPHLVAKQSQKELTDPEVLLQAGMGYLGQQFNNPAFALRLLQGLRAKVGADTFDGDQMWTLVHGIGLAQLTLGKREEAIPTWKEAIALAEKTTEPTSGVSNSYYNLACAYSLLGRLDEAFEALGKAYASGATEQLEQLKQHGEEDADLENMRKDPRWKTLYAEGSIDEEEEEGSDE